MLWADPIQSNSFGGGNGIERERVRSTALS